MSTQYPLCPEADSLETRASAFRRAPRCPATSALEWERRLRPVALTGLEGTTAPLEEIRLAVVFFLSRDEYRARHEHSGGNSDQGPHSDNPLGRWTQPSGTVLLRKGRARHHLALVDRGIQIPWQ